MHHLHVRLEADARWVLTPHGMFRLSNPDAIRPGQIHIVRYQPFDQWATIVEGNHD